MEKINCSFIKFQNLTIACIILLLLAKKTSIQRGVREEKEKELIQNGSISGSKSSVTEQKGLWKEEYYVVTSYNDNVFYFNLRLSEGMGTHIHFHAQTHPHSPSTV